MNKIYFIYIMSDKPPKSSSLFENLFGTGNPEPNKTGNPEPNKTEPDQTGGKKKSSRKSKTARRKRKSAKRKNRKSRKSRK